MRAKQYLLCFLFVLCMYPANAVTVYQTLVAGETLKVEGMRNLKFSKAGRVSLADINLIYTKSKERKTYPVSVRLMAVDQFKTKSDAEPSKTHTLENDPQLSIEGEGDLQLKIDRNDDRSVKKVKVILRYKLNDPQGVFYELKFESDDITELYESIYNKTAKGPDDKIAESLTKRAINKLFLENLKWETLQAAAKEKQYAISTTRMPPPGAELVPASVVIQNPVNQHKSGLLKVRDQFKGPTPPKE